MLNTQLAVYIILLATLILFIWGKWRYDVVAGMALMATVLVGAIPVAQAFNGFANAAVITVAAVMVISQVISDSGVTALAAKGLKPFTKNPLTHVAALTIIAAVLSAFMNNVGALTLLMPLAIQTALREQRSPAMLLMPLAFGSILGGTMTLIGTPPNIIISSYRLQAVGQPFNMFDFSPVGIGVTIVGLLFVVFIGWRLIPKERMKRKAVEDSFLIQDYITEIHLTEKSTLIGRTVAEVEALAEEGAYILGIIRSDKKRTNLSQEMVLNEEDIVVISAPSKQIEQLVNATKSELMHSKKIGEETVAHEDNGIMEVVVPPRSTIEGFSVKRLQLRSRYHINLVAISRQGKPFRQRISQVALTAGDILLLQGDTDTLKETVTELGFLPLAGSGIEIGLRRSKSMPLLLFAGAIALSAFNILPIQISFSLAVLLMILFNMISLKKAYQSVDWSIIVLLGAMIPVGESLVATGGAQFIGHSIASFAAHVQPWMILGLILLITMILTDIINNAATAVVMAPIALSVAEALHMNVDPFLMAVAIGASCAFMTPIGHQNNTLVMGPGGYRFGDYWRMGLPLKMIVLIAAIPLLEWFWPLHS